MAGKNAFRAHVQLVAAGSTADVLKYPEEGNVSREERHHVTLLSWEDVTTNWTKTRCYVELNERALRVFDSSDKTLATVYYFPYEIVLTEGEQLCLYISGATLGDVLHLWAQGYWVEE